MVPLGTHLVTPRPRPEQILEGMISVSQGTYMHRARRGLTYGMATKPMRRVWQRGQSRPMRERRGWASRMQAQSLHTAMQPHSSE